jgi:hypothetical protein
MHSCSCGLHGNRNLAQSRTGTDQFLPVPDESDSRGATCKAAENDCLTRRKSIRPCVLYDTQRMGSQYLANAYFPEEVKGKETSLLSSIDAARVRRKSTLASRRSAERLRGFATRRTCSDLTTDTEETCVQPRLLEPIWSADNSAAAGCNLRVRRRLDLRHCVGSSAHGRDQVCRDDARKASF